MRQLFSKIRRWFTIDPGVESNRNQEQQDAKRLVEEGVRGKAGAAKIAQLLGYWEDPEGFSDGTAKENLAALFDRIPKSSTEPIDSIFVEDFGKPKEALFSSFEEAAFAAASLGEVHGARGHDGIEYAVKVQYPHVAKTLAQDLENPDVVEKLLGASMGEEISEAAKQALRTVILSELDYKQEAAFLKRFSAAFSEEPHLVFPKVNPLLSSHRILTTTRLYGEPLLPFLMHAEESQRTLLGNALFQYGFLGPIEHGLLNTDPNPGNFLVLEEGRKLGLLDFGACIELSQHQLTYERVFWQSLLAQDAEVMRYTLYRMGLVRDPIEFDSDTFRGWERLIALPFQTESFLWTSSYAKAFTAQTAALVKGRRFTLPKEFLLLFRQRIGLFALLGLCHAQIHARKLLSSMLHQA